ncbi:hypothetical protein TI04_09610 [Achromatium sp. WMS2]|nr:hypothetical protein TI04_09610 [Achromatium sp. WMS2]
MHNAAGKLFIHHHEGVLLDCFDELNQVIQNFVLEHGMTHNLVLEGLVDLYPQECIDIKFVAVVEINSLLEGL